MARAAASASPGSSPVERIYDSLPWNPGWVGALLASTLYGGFLIVELLLGRRPFRLDQAPLEGSGEALITLLLCVVLAYLCSATISASREGPRALARLLPLLDLPQEDCRRIVASAAERPRAFTLGAAVVGLLLGVAAPFLEPGTPVHPYDLTRISPESTWHRFLAPLVGWWSGRLVAVMLVDSVRHSRLAARIPRIDLLDLRPLDGFARLGLSNARRVVWIAALFSPFALDLRNYAALLTTVAVTTVASATAVLVLPVRGIHRRICLAKERELASVNRAIRGEPEALDGTAIAARSQPPSLADLIAYHGLVESAREWPFDATTVKRFGLYLLIPLGSWSGGALVERAIDALLD